MIEKLEIWIEDVQFDLTQDWNEEKELMLVQLQQLIIAKSNLDFENGQSNFLFFNT